MNPPPLPGAQTEKVRSGQSLLILSIVLNLASTVLRLGLPNDRVVLIVSGLMAVGALVLGVIGILRMARGLGYHWALTVLLCVLIVVPCINLIVLLIINAQATKHLREAGYRVGLLGAKK